jgi:hypothetical protein
MKRPLLISLFSILHLLIAALNIMFAARFLFIPRESIRVLLFQDAAQSLGSLELPVLVGIPILIALVTFSIGLGLWRLKRWARIAALCLAVLGIIIALLTLQSQHLLSIMQLGMNVLIVLYLGFSKEVKKAFA